MQEQNKKHDLENIKSMKDPQVEKMVQETPEGKNPYYHVIGSLGGNAVKKKYANLKNDRELIKK